MRTTEKWTDRQIIVQNFSFSFIINFSTAKPFSHFYIKPERLSGSPTYLKDLSSIFQLLKLFINNFSLMLLPNDAGKSFVFLSPRDFLARFSIRPEETTVNTIRKKILK